MPPVDIIAKSMIVSVMGR